MDGAGNDQSTRAAERRRRVPRKHDLASFNRHMYDEGGVAPRRRNRVDEGGRKRVSIYCNDVKSGSVANARIDSSAASVSISMEIAASSPATG